MRPPEAALSTLKYLHPDGGVFELCVISPTQNTSNLWEGRAFGKKPIVAGWFKDPEQAAKLAVQIKAEGIYTTLNPCQDALLARADQRLKANVDRTADNHIERLKNLLIDIDPIRPAGISSTDQEHRAALEMAEIIQADLSKEGWPKPLPGDSENGGHLIYPLDLPNDDESKNLVKAVLEALAWRYTDELKRRNLEIDQKVFNPARLTKLYGTMARKGDNTEDRPHRLARIISLPETRQTVPMDLLKRMAATIPRQEKPQAQNAEAGASRLDVEAYLKHYGVEVVKVKPHASGFLHCLEKCLFDPSHNDNEAAIGQTADGKLFYQCFHNSCKGRTWAEAKQRISGDATLAKFIIGSLAKENTKKKPKEQTSEEKPTQQDVLLTIAAAAELFHTPDEECYARLPVNGHSENWPIRSRGFKRWLSHEFFKSQGKGPQGEALPSALQVLEARAQFDAPERPVWVRVAEHEGQIYIDLGNPAWEVIEITPHGWQVMTDAPVCFRRSRSMLPLPYPERGGSMNELRPFLNVASDSDFILMVAFILAAMRPRGPYPVKVVNGEQGAAKTTTGRVIGSLIDPPPPHLCGPLPEKCVT